VAARRAEPGGHREWAQLCEEAGEAGLALTEYQLALRDDPADVAALSRLAVLYEERGEMDQAAGCADRWARASQADAEAARCLVGLLLASERLDEAREALDRAAAGGVPEEVVAALRSRLAAARREDAAGEEEVVPGVPSDADVVRFAHLFSGRENVHARQWWGESGAGGYTPVREPMTFQVARNHLLGSLTVGVYPIRLDNTVTLFAVDLDINKSAIARARGSAQEARRLKDLVAAEARRLLAEMAALGLPALLEDSGYKGRHLWVFLETPEDASVVRQLGSLLLARFPVASKDLHAEFFPKQASAGAGIGNLIKLPLGIHRRTGRRSRLLQADGAPHPDPFAALRAQPRVPRASLHAAIAALKSQAAAAAAAPGGVPGPAPAGGEPAPAPPALSRDAEEPSAAPPAVPAPPAPAPAWTWADFETNPEVSRLLRGCPVLDALKRKVEAHRRLTHDERIVLVHSVGHSGAGVLAVNHLLDACVDVPPGERLQTPLSGNPISCPKIRKRIPHVTGSVPCNCEFDFAPDRYPTPRLHLLAPAAAAAPEARGAAARSAGAAAGKPASPAAPPAWDPADRARALGVLRLRRHEIEREIASLESDLLEFMERSGTALIDTGDGALRVIQEEGCPPALEWRPRAGPGDPAPGGQAPPSGSGAPPEPPPQPGGRPTGGA
jgi:hypothetical protein